jgi:hypothetical protein
VDKSDFDRIQREMEKIKDELPGELKKMAIAEGEHYVTVAQRKSPEDTGMFKSEWRASPPRQAGNSLIVELYNNSAYAKHIEYGFRAHFVPLEYFSRKYQQKFIEDYSKEDKNGELKPPKGVIVGAEKGYVQGRFIMKYIKHDIKTTQTARLQEQMDAIAKEWDKRLNGGGGE